MKKFYKLLSLLILITMLLGIFSGCNAQNKQTDSSTSTTDSQKTTDSSQGSKEQTSDTGSTGGKITDKPITLTCWASLNSNVAQHSSSYSEIPLYKELEKRTGVKIEFLHPPVGQENEQFNLMIASNELPDMIEYNWLGYPGGPEKAMQDGIIMPLNDVIDQYAPNLKKYFAANEDIAKMVKTDNGNYYCFPFIRGDDFLTVFYGPQIRKDWLDEYGLEIPTTISEWETVLKELINKKGLDAGITLSGTSEISMGGFIVSAYGVLYGFMQENGQVKYGPIEPGFKDALATLEKWYREGILDPDFAAQDAKTKDAKITGDRVAAYVGYSGSGMGKYTPLVRQQNPKFELAGAPWPTLNKGEIPITGQKDNPYIGGGSVAITTQCDELEIAAKWLDYGYSEEGHMLYNFGIEDVSYKMVNGYPTYTDLITKNPDGLSMGQALAQYCRSSFSGPFVQDRRYQEQYLQYPEQVEALKTWGNHKGLLKMPPITPTPEESQRYASIMSEINTYVSEMFLKFVMGQESIDKFDSFVEQIKKMNIEEAIKIQQAALDRYYKR